MKVFYYMSDNLGDGMNPLVFRHFIKTPITYGHIAWGSNPARSETEPCILGAGSILGMIPTSPAVDIVCGSGFIQPGMTVQPVRQILSVRGALTRDMYLRAGIACAEVYGDLGLLLRYIIPKPTVEKKFKIGLIPHFVDYDACVARVRGKSDWTVLNIRQADTPDQFVRQLHECDLILSSSLHGIVFADSYGIPAHHTVLSDRVIGGEFKFRDYYSSVKRDYFHVSIDSLDTEAIQRACTPYKCDFDFDGYYAYITAELGRIAAT